MNNQVIMSPQEEAVRWLGDVIAELSTSNRDLKSILRKCQHICELLEWQEPRNWFYQELNGYPSVNDLPYYRKVTGIKKWDIDAEATSYEYRSWTVRTMASRIDPSIYEQEEDVLGVWSGIDWFLSAARNGFIENLPEKRKVLLSQSQYNLRRIRVFAAINFANCIAQLEGDVFTFASKAYIQVKYGGAVKNIWDDYSNAVDKSLNTLNLFPHLQAIQSGLLSENPESWRNAIFGCRNLLTDLANYLWQDGRPRYDLLPGKTDDGKLDVSQGNFGNRLAAYLHQKSISGKSGKHLRNEAERVASSIHSLIAFQSEAHDPIREKLDARSIAISTYILIGEIVLRTDLNPVRNYGTPASSSD